MRTSYDNFDKIKYLLALFAVGIVSLSVYYTSRLADDMSQEEQKRIKLWAEATQQIVSDDNASLEFALKVIEDNTTIPAIIAGEDGNIFTYRNISPPESDPDAFLKSEIVKLRGKHKPITIQLDEETTQYLYYDDSTLLKRLAYFPYVQWLIIMTFCVILFLVFTSAKKAEQDRVWVGLSKETAHQLGTPISSLLAWVEILKCNEEDSDLISEIEKDVNRLKTIAERFSKIGSTPEKEEANLREILESTASYMQKRASSRIRINCHYDLAATTRMRLCKPLFEWVVENLCKNAIDAMDGKGRIDIRTFEKDGEICIDVQDTGKGIAKSKFKTVFKPGYTTKKRGWGLGLSLAKRIVEEYHDGKIFVKKSEFNKGTTFRIQLKNDLTT